MLLVGFHYKKAYRRWVPILIVQVRKNCRVETCHSTLD